MAEFIMKDTVLQKCKPAADETDLVIPNGVTRIAPKAFYKLKTIRTVTIPETVTKIGHSAFELCPDLTVVTIMPPQSPDTGLKHIEYQAFDSCQQLTICKLPETVTKIERWAFSGCTALREMSLPDGLTDVSDHLLSCCESITKAVIPAGMTTVPPQMFSGCINLSEVTVHEGVTEINAEAFKDCKNLHDITLPESLTLISRDAFSGSGIRRLRIPANVRILAHGFRDCAELTEIEFAVFPQKGTKIREYLEDILWDSPELVAVILRGNQVPQDFRDFLDWMEKERHSSKEEFPKDDNRPWYEALIDMLEADDYILILDTNSCVSMQLYRVIGSEYERSYEMNNSRFGKTPPFKRWEDTFKWMMDNDQALRAYRYENGKLTEIRELSKQVYDSWVYEGCVNAVILRDEFGLKPKDEKAKADFAANLAKAEKFRQTLVYACYVDDRSAILERAKTASKTALNETFEYFGTPLTFCAKHDFPEGFRIIAERGGDITKQIVGGTVSPIGEALAHSPSITLYIAQEHPETFDTHHKNWNHCYELARCSDTRVWDILFRRWGAEGMEALYFTYLLDQSNVNLTMIQYLIEHGADFLRVNSDFGCHALEFAQQQYEKYCDESHKAALELLQAAARK